MSQAAEEATPPTITEPVQPRITATQPQGERAQANAAALALQAEKSVAGHAFLDLLNPPPRIILRWSKYNKRAANQSKINQFVVGYKMRGIQYWENHIHVLVPRDLIVHESLRQIPITSPVGEILRLKPVATDTYIIVLGGHHRKLAYEQRRKEFKDNIATIKKQLDDLSEMADLSEADETRFAADLKAQLHVLQQGLDEPCKWAAVIHYQGA